MGGLVTSWLGLRLSFPKERPSDKSSLTGGFFREVVPETKVGNGEERSMEGRLVQGDDIELITPVGNRLLPLKGSLGNLVSVP